MHRDSAGRFSFLPGNHVCPRGTLGNAASHDGGGLKDQVDLAKYGAEGMEFTRCLQVLL
ncbi:MAG: hypothetical protein U5K36_04825 [Roseovarius sp.]|nr:hypothetical protein [Roseovarius sp.]